MNRIKKDISNLLIEIKSGNSCVEFIEGKEGDPFGENGSMSNTNNFSLILKGPEKSPYEGGKFKIKFVIPSDYPFAPPKVTFENKIYHPNILDKNICIDILKDNWTPAYYIYQICLSLSSLLENPNPNDPLNIDAANEYVNNYNSFKTKAQQITNSNN